MVRVTMAWKMRAEKGSEAGPEARCGQTKGSDRSVGQSTQGPVGRPGRHRGSAAAARHWDSRVAASASPSAFTLPVACTTARVRVAVT